MKFSGAVLAGGRSSRFGQDKASYLYGGKPLAVWALESFTAASERFVVSSRPYTFGVPVYGDLYPGSSLGGLHAALTYAKHDWVALAACDMPFLTPDYWQQLLVHTENVHAVVVSGPEGRPQPLAAVYHKSLLPFAETQLKSGYLKIQTFIQQADARILPCEALELDPKTFFNANYLADLKLSHVTPGKAPE